MKRILILAANPKNSDKLRLDEEVREIQEGLQRSRSRDQFEIISKWVVRPEDLRRALLDHTPHIVHFSGLSAEAKGLRLENNAGKMTLVSAESLARLFKLFQKEVECVLLNACYLEAQATAIHQHINYVMGMNHAIGDRVATEFAIGFYDALVAGRSYSDAFEFGFSAIDLEVIPASATPQLKLRPGATAKIPSQTTTLVTALTLEAPTESSPISSALVVSQDQTAVSSESNTPPIENQLSQPPSLDYKSRIFISHKKGVIPDETIAREIYQALSLSHEVFIDQTILVGTPWVEHIEKALRQSDVLIVLLSAESVHSEMMMDEIQKAHQLMTTSGRPIILPVRLAYREPFHYPLSAYLNPINWAFWESPTDTPQLIEELRKAIDGMGLSIGSEKAKREVMKLSALPAPDRLYPYPSASQVSAKLATSTMASEPSQEALAPFNSTDIHTEYLNTPSTVKTYSRKMLGETQVVAHAFWDKSDRIAIMIAGGAAIGSAILQIPGLIIGALSGAAYGFYISFYPKNHS